MFQRKEKPNQYRKNLKAQEIWDNDKIKLNECKNNGYDVLVIWEDDYKDDKEGVLQKCLDFLGGI